MSATSLQLPGRVWKKRPLRRKSHRNAKPTARESFAQLKAWIRTGVSPRGAHVRRTGGRCETPLSSWKTIQARRRRAFFLPRASASSSSAGWRARFVPSRVWPDVAASSRARPRGAKHGPGDTSRRAEAIVRGRLEAGEDPEALWARADRVLSGTEGP